ncbi:MAG: SDR family oxidoreductase, partial [Planctomycetota bacterium]|nr:SDR family oxidoreductase [Planctomycetota bacterium]
MWGCVVIEQSHATGERIADRLRGRHLLVTGSTGLLAKVFTEKLLRCVPEIGGIHLLVRPRRSDQLTSEQRVEREVLGSTVFDRLRALIGPRFEPLCREKIQVVDGDLMKEHFGLEDDAYEALAGKIDTVVNSAATVTFDERLDIARSLNALGPSRLMRFARDCGNVPFMQVSTCYVSGKKTGDIPEEMHTLLRGAPVDLDAVIEEMKRECDRILEECGEGVESERKKLIAAGMDFSHRYDRNDTYTFTKWLGEQLVDRDRGDVPVVILRPAIIESSLEEPVPGWIDGLRMADPMVIAYGRGSLTDFPGEADVPIDIIPVDLVANAMIAALEGPGALPGLKVYQVGSSAGNTMLVSEFVKYLEEGFQRRPMLDEKGRPIRVRSFGIVDLESYHRKCDRHLARAMRIREWLTRWNVSTQKRRRISSAIVRIEQLKYFASIYSPYTHLDCRFLDGQLRALADSLHPEDRKAFPFDVAAIDWREYVVNRHVPGLRKFVLASAREGQQPIPMPRDAEPDDVGVQRSIQKSTTIFDAFQHTARLCGEKVALQMGRGRRWVRYTFQDALAATASIARRFDEFGLAPGDRVAIYGENGPSWGLTYLAAMRAGLTAVPLDPQLPAEEVLECARFAGAKLVCAGKSLFESIRAASEPTAGEDGSPSIVAMVEPFIPPPGASRDESRPTPLVRGDHVASILFTSGTTVAPKAVQLTHTNLLSNVRAIAKAQPLGPRDNFLSVLPLHHALEFTCGFLLPLTAGVTITYVERLKGPEIIQAMRLTKTTVMLVVPKLLKLFLDGIERQVAESGLAVRGLFRLLGVVSDASGRRLARQAFAKVHRQFGGHLRLFVCGGSALDAELHSAFGRMGFVVSEGYG